MSLAIDDLSRDIQADVLSAAFSWDSSIKQRLLRCGISVRPMSALGQKRT